MKEIGFFLEQYLIPLRYYDNLKNFIYSLSKSNNLTIYSPNIDVINLNNFNENKIKVIELNDFNIKTSSNYRGYFDIFIIFSTYNKDLCFDRRQLVINSMKFSSIIMIPSYNFLNYDPLNENIHYFTDEFSDFSLCHNVKEVESIFDKQIKYNQNDIDSFYSEYKINSEKKIIAFIPGKLLLWHNNYNDDPININNILGKFFISKLNEIKLNINENYEILGVKSYEDSYEDYCNINVINWIKDKDYNILKSLSSIIITISNIDVLKYMNLQKKVINIGIPITKDYFNSENNRHLISYCLKKSKYIKSIYKKEDILNLHKFFDENLDKNIKVISNDNNDIIRKINNINNVEDNNGFIYIPKNTNIRS